MVGGKDLVLIPVSHYEDKGQLSDGTRKAVVYYGEMNDDQMLNYMRNTRTAGVMAFSASGEIDDIPDVTVSDHGQKTPSMRLRNTLYRVWEQNTDMTEDFQTQYYPRIMEKLINQYKELLV